MKLITNTSNNRMFKCLLNKSHDTNVYIAVAFFTDSKLLLDIINNNCQVKLIVRLNYGTNPNELLKIIDKTGVQIRFFTSTQFHPKLYIFENDAAYIGSSNFTQGGLKTNNELNIEVDKTDSIFSEVLDCFNNYWVEAQVLTKTHIKKCIEIFNNKPLRDNSQNLIKELGEFAYSNNENENNESGAKKYISDFRKSHQNLIAAFNIIKDIYKKLNIRLYPQLPLKIEVDRFLWWLGVEYKIKDSNAKKTTAEIESFLTPLIKEFKNANSDHLNDNFVDHYQNTINRFSNKKNIENATYDEIFNALNSVNSFREHYKRYGGGVDVSKNKFLSENTLPKIKKTLEYLLYGSGDYEERLYNCIKDDNYKLYYFGRSSCLELYGMINNNDIPPFNDKTIESIKYIGFSDIQIYY